MERLWAGDVSVKYPKQWIVLVNLNYDNDMRKHMGDVYFVTDDEQEAYDKAKEIGNTMGKRMVVRGFDDTPQIGGLEIWNKAPWFSV